MNQAVSARRGGDTFQARQFWYKALPLLDPDSPVIGVGFEKGPKGFDDIWVEYAPGREPKDTNGEPIKCIFIQCKWHVILGTYGFKDLIDPKFINAKSGSLLQRARDACLNSAQSVSGVQFKLLTNWRPKSDDPLNSLVNQRTGSINLDKLYKTKTDKSKMGEVRKAWREHLEINDEELRQVVKTLAFGHTLDTLDEMRSRLDKEFKTFGLKRIPINESSFKYDDLIFCWMNQGHNEFDKNSFKVRCQEEGLFIKTPENPQKFGIKSFEHSFDRLEDRCTSVLNLIPYFNGRFIQDESLWFDKLYPEITTYLSKITREQQKIRLVLDIHSSLAFVTGSILNMKVGRKVELEQRTISRSIWSADDYKVVDPNWPTLNQNVHDLNSNGTDIAVAVGITHNITNDVKSYAKEKLPSVGKILEVCPSTGSGNQVVSSGRHAFEFAQTVKEKLRSTKRDHELNTKTHLFIAAPNSFTFFLGQQTSALGRVQLYEFDFEGQGDRSYQPSLALPK